MLSAITAQCCPPSERNGVRDRAEYAFTLVDLDPDDDVSPTFAIGAGPGFYWNRATYTTQAGWPIGRTLKSPTPFDALSVVGRAIGADFATAYGPSTFAPGGRKYHPSAFACYHCRLVLGPHTRLVVAGDYALAAVDEVRHNPAYWDGPATAGVSLEVTDATTSVARFEDSLSTTRDGVADSLARNGSFWLAVDNLRPYRYRDFSFTVGAQGIAHSPHVPEPGTYCLTIAGLAILGLAARRSGGARRSMQCA